MTKKSEMRIKDVGATINLGNYSTLHVTIGESAEYQGLELQRSIDYLREIASQTGGILNLPDELAKSKKNKKVAPTAENRGVKNIAFGNAVPVWYEHSTHSYTTDDGMPLTSVTQFLSKFYPMNANIAQEYMDFAASFGNLVHTSIQNAAIGKPPKKNMVKGIVNDAMDALGAYQHVFVEQLIVLPEDGLAGRFDILTENEGKNTLWDVKTNSDLFLSVECNLPKPVEEYLLDFWNPQTTYGEHCLQLNLYAYMLGKVGRLVEDIKILHVPDEFNKVYTVPRIDVPYFLEMVNGQQRTRA